MNYFSHARPFLDQPYFVAGTAMPDWLRVVDKRVRARSKTVASFLDQHADKLNTWTRAICDGIIQHHSDDDWFHNSPTFLAMNVQFTNELRILMQDDASMRAGFVGHISIELLLDAALIERSPSYLADYYRVLDGLDPVVIELALEQILGRKVEHIGKLIRRFSIERFMYDYLEDARLLKRLNQIMARVGLATLPIAMLDWLPKARQAVYNRSSDLLPGLTEPGTRKSEHGLTAL